MCKKRILKLHKNIMNLHGPESLRRIKLALYIYVNSAYAQKAIDTGRSNNPYICDHSFASANLQCIYFK